MPQAGRLTTSVPPGIILPDSARWKPSEIPSKTRSVSAFPPGRVSVGPSFSGKVDRQAPQPPADYETGYA
jgi:hypothetical protein